VKNTPLWKVATVAAAVLTVYLVVSHDYSVRVKTRTMQIDLQPAQGPLRLSP
jgi:hypothetical protein